MWRILTLSVSCLAITACASVSRSVNPSLLERAEAATKLRSDIDTLSTFAVAKYAGLTEDPLKSAQNYARLLSSVSDDPWVAEQAIFSVMRVGEVERAVKLAKRLPQETILQTELPRLLLAVDAVKLAARPEDDALRVRHPVHIRVNTVHGPDLLQVAVEVFVDREFSAGFEIL